MLSCSVAQTCLRQTFPGLKNGMQSFYLEFVSLHSDDRLSGLRSGAITQQSVPVCLTETPLMQTSPGTPPTGAAVEKQTTGTGSALVWDSKKHIPTTPASREGSLRASSAGKDRHSVMKGNTRKPHGKIFKQGLQFSEILRADLASGAATVSMFSAQDRAAGQGRRPDLQYFKVRETLRKLRNKICDCQKNSQLRHVLSLNRRRRRSFWSS